MQIIGESQKNYKSSISGKAENCGSFINNQIDFNSSVNSFKSSPNQKDVKSDKCNSFVNHNEHEIDENYFNIGLEAINFSNIEDKDILNKISTENQILCKDDSIQSIAQELEEDECIQVKKTFESKVKQSKHDEQRISDKVISSLIILKPSKSVLKPNTNEGRLLRKITHTIGSESTGTDKIQKESFDTYSAK